MSALDARAGEITPLRAPAQSSLQFFFPEVGAGGFARCDGTVAFYSRVNALVRPTTVLLDYGAGRGVAHREDQCAYRRSLLGFRGKVSRVIGVDVDPAVLTNPALDQALLLDGSRIPLPDASVDMVLADWVFEHVPNPTETVSEIARVLRPGGWICARTPNRWHYQYLAAKVIPDRHHQHVLRHVQSTRKEMDIFPKHYLLNDMGSVRRHFGSENFQDYSYTYQPPPAYLPENRALWRLALLVDAITPPPLRANIFVFARKRER